MNSSEEERDAAKGNRIYFLDNLRTFMIFLVVLCHAGWVYESSGIGAYFWIVDDPSTNDLSGLLNIILDIFMMPTLFFISGYFAPSSMSNKNSWAFLKSKFKRLIIPWTVAVLTLIPLYKVIFLSSRNLPQESWTSYFHWSNGIISQSWLWFLPVLFGFNILYLLLLKGRIRIPAMSLKGAILGTFLIGFAYSVSMDIFGLRGWTKISLLDFQNERLLIYFMVFLMGAHCFRLKVFDAGHKSKLLYITANSTAWIPVTVYIIFLLYPWLKPGHHIVSEIIDRLILWSSYLLSLLCLMYVMLETSRRYFDKPRRMWSGLSRNSYGVYIIHVIVMGGFALLLLDSAVPSLLKHLILVASTFGASNLLIYSGRRLMTSSILNSRIERSTMKTVTTAILLTMFLTGIG
ncbi:MAG: acyltransferase family protein [Sedimentisphaerales bacterium]